MDLQLAQQHILITGGSKGIGRRCADYFAADGAHVAFCARDQKGVDEASAALKAQGVTVFGQAVDVGDKAALESWIAASAKAMARAAPPAPMSATFLSAVSHLSSARLARNPAPSVFSPTSFRLLVMTMVLTAPAFCAKGDALSTYFKTVAL